jgi:hypothetical protein
VTSIVTRAYAFFFFKLLNATSTTAATIIKNIPKTLLAASTVLVNLYNLFNKLLSTVVFNVTKLYPEFVKLFGAVAKYTFIVPMKKLKNSVVKVRTQWVTKGKK